MPSQVRNAVVLLWASLALSSLESGIALLVQWSDEDELDRYTWWFLTGSSLLLATANVYVIYCASRRKNWARIVQLGVAFVVGALVLPSHVIWSSEWGEGDWQSNATSAAYVIMDAIAIYWLFTGAGARWYAKNEQAGF